MSYNILIIGGTGSLGSELTRFYHSKGWNVTVYSRDGHKQQALSMALPDVKFVLGDICDENSLRFALQSQQYVVNAAAQKIVHQGEAFVDEFIRVNITGGQLVARLCYDMGIFNVLQISSDKACEPINLYGKTKAITEDVFLSYGYSALRYGNVVDSRGSFWNIWNDQISRGEKISLRNPYPTRFILTIKDAVLLVDDAINLGHMNTVFVPKDLSAFSIESVARAMGILDWIDKPLLPGEKQHEKLLADAENGHVVSSLLATASKSEIENKLYRNHYNSGFAHRITGEEFLEIVGGK